jgi:hypothetical protein
MADLVMNREETVRLLVLNSIGDGPENFDQIILPDVTRWGGKLGWKIDRPEIANALAWLVKNGMAEAFNFDPQRQHSVQIEGFPDLERVSEDLITCFRITDEGMKLHLQPNEVLDILDWS